MAVQSFGWYVENGKLNLKGFMVIDNVMRNDYEPTVQYSCLSHTGDLLTGNIHLAEYRLDKGLMSKVIIPKLATQPGNYLS